MSKKIFNTRTGRNREQTIKVYSLFLVTLRQNHEQGINEPLKALCERLHISSSISPKDFPKDLFTAPYEKVASLDYAREWFNGYLQPLRQQRRVNTLNKAKVVATDENALTGILEAEQPSLADIMAEIERLTNTFIEDSMQAINQAKSLINQLNTIKL